MRTSQTSSTCFLISTMILLPSTNRSTLAVCDVCDKELSALCFRKGVVRIEHGQLQVIVI